MAEPIKVEMQSFGEFVEGIKGKDEEARKKFKENGGMCLHCGKNPGEKSGVNPFHCKACNKKTESILQELRGSGFMEFGGGRGNGLA